MMSHSSATEAHLISLMTSQRVVSWMFHMPQVHKFECSALYDCKGNYTRSADIKELFPKCSSELTEILFYFTNALSRSKDLPSLLQLICSPLLDLLAYVSYEPVFFYTVSNMLEVLKLMDPEKEESMSYKAEMRLHVRDLLDSLERLSSSSDSVSAIIASECQSHENLARDLICHLRRYGLTVIQPILQENIKKEQPSFRCSHAVYEVIGSLLEHKCTMTPCMVLELSRQDWASPITPMDNPSTFMSPEKDILSLSQLDLLSSSSWGEGLWCCNEACDNLSGPSELKLKTFACGGKCGMRYCSRACQEASWRAGHNKGCSMLASRRAGLTNQTCGDGQ